VTLARALETVPGVGFVSEGQAATPAVRGLARGRTLLLVDGSRVTSERRAGPNASFLDPGTARTIDVARGPGSVAYGSDAFGGVVAVETRRADPATPLAVMFAATAAEGAPERRGEFEITAGYGSGGVLLAVRDRRFRDYDAPLARVANSAWADAGARLRWDHDDGNTRWSAGWQRDAGRDIGRPRSDSDNILAVTPIESSHRLNATYARRRLGGFTNVRVDVLAARSRDRTEQIRTPSRQTPRRVTRADIRASDFQVRATTDRAAGNARLTIGGDVLARHGVHATDSTLAFDLADRQTSITTTVSIDSARRVQTGAFVQADVPLGSRFSAVAGARADSVRSTAAGAHFGDVSVEHASVSGLVAAIVRPFPTDTAITVQLARGFRDPTLSDRFHRGPVGRGVIEGNPDLAPETSRQFDLAVRHAAAPVTMTAAYYDYRIHDLIERYAATPDLFRFRNRGRARIRGLEVQAQVDLGQGVALDAAAHRSRGRDADDDTPLDDIAPDAVSVGLRYAAEGMAATSLRFARIAAHDEAGPSEVATPGYTLVEAGLAVTVRRGLEARFTVRNLLDAPYHSDAGPRWVSAPGRHGSLTLVLTWPSAR
jgi:outer membrane receptor protein involved in Fe transport